MFLNKIIFLLALFLVVSEVNSKCETTTTDDPNNRIETSTKAMETSIIDITLGY